MERRAHAKINWMLRITGRRPDGYHDLETIFQAISLHDTLRFTPSDHLSLHCDDPRVPSNESNLVMRAARALQVNDVAIELHKRIPSGGGLGGGSSDAAATLLELAPGGISPGELRRIALGLGSDVPFFLTGGTAYGTGRGEELMPLPGTAGIPLLLVFPQERMSTARAFGMLRRFSPAIGVERVRELVGESAWLRAKEFVNDFEEPVFAALPQLRSWKERLIERGAIFASMSGSGSTLFGVFRTAGDRDAAAVRFGDVRVERAETL